MNPTNLRADELVLVDGSFGEGGGQIIRNGVTLACILKKKLQVINIRANRPNPGLASQHLESILALLRLTGATSKSNLRKGLTEFELDASGDIPGEAGNSKSDCLETTIDLKTAGSVTLCIQCILPYLLALRSPSCSKITIIGGTHVMKAPNVDYMCRVFIPTMNQIGYKFSIQLLRPGYFPRGGGRVILNIHEGNQGKFHPFTLRNKRGNLLEKSAILNLTPPLYENQKEKLASRIRSVEPKSLLINKVNYASVEYFLKYERATFGFYRLLEGRPPNPTAAEVIDAIDAVEAEFNEMLGSTACVDSFMQDQLIIYMTLAKLQDPSQTSLFTTVSPLSDHTLSAIHVSELITGLKFNVTVSDGVAQVAL